MNFNDNENERFYIWWHCLSTQNRSLAGVAYYNEGSGEYRLCLNFFPDNHYSLKCVSATHGNCRYRLLSVRHRKAGTTRFYQGDGVLNNNTNEIVIQAAPFSKLLILTLNEVGERQKEA